MDVEDFVDSEVAIAVAATAAVLSPRVRGVLRRGAVYGLAGGLIAGSAVASAARGVGHGAQQATSSAGGVLQGVTSRARGAIGGGSTRSAGGEA